jgi:hypothetical protein
MGSASNAPKMAALILMPAAAAWGRFWGQACFVELPVEFLLEFELGIILGIPVDEHATKFVHSP